MLFSSLYTAAMITESVAVLQHVHCANVDFYLFSSQSQIMEHLVLRRFDIIRVMVDCHIYLH